VTAGGPACLRIALLGTGWIMDFHARAALEHPGAELVAAANWRQPSLDRLAGRYGIARTTPTGGRWPPTPRSTRP
jgi:predicted dehydrogenase